MPALGIKPPETAKMDNIFMDDIMVFVSMAEASEAARRLTHAHLGLIKFYPAAHPTKRGLALEAVDFIGRTGFYRDSFKKKAPPAA
jgi:hypothetical protein